MNIHLRTIDHSVSKEEFELRYDSEMDMLVTYPEPKDLEKYYESNSYISHTDSAKTLMDKTYQVVKKFGLWKKIKLINKYTLGQNSLLDIGAGTGDFLLYAKNKGWKINGVEPNFGARMRAREKRIELVPDMESLPNSKFEIVTLWHVLEHLPNLDKQIKDILSFLGDNGTLVIAVPNYKSFDAKFYEEFWAAYDVPRHLWHFSRVSIERLFSKFGLEVVATKPMIFDAFYVSILSEKYRSGKNNMLKGFWTGLKSNISAFSSKEYSSIIYILKKS